MKSFQQLFIFTLYAGLTLGSACLLAAEGEDPKSTPYSYKNGKYKGEFCAQGAEDMMADLQKANERKFEQIEEYRDQIENLQKYDSLINEVTAIKKRYVDSVAKAAAHTPDTETIKKLEDAKSILRHGLILNAIATVTAKKTTSTPAEEMSTSKQIYYQMADKISSILKLDKDSQNAEIQKLHESVNNFKEVSGQLPPPDQETLNKQVQKIISEIPKEISPENLLNILEKESPLMLHLASSKLSRADLELCLSEKSSQSSLDACDKILTKPEDRKKLIETIGYESSKFTQSLESKDTAIKLAVDNNKSELEKSLSHYESDKSKSSREETKKSITAAITELSQYSQNYNHINHDIKKTINLKAGQMSIASHAERSVEQATQEAMLYKETDLIGVENFFYKKPDKTTFAALGIDITTKEGAVKAQKLQQEAIDNAVADAKIFNKDCDFSNQINAENEDAKIKVCKGLVEQLNPQIDQMKNSHQNKIAELNVKIQKLAGDNDFAATENLKKYVAEKYLCSCEKDKRNVKSNNIESLSMTSGTCTNQFMTLTQIEGLSKSSSIIATALYAHEIKMPMDKENCAFGPEQMKTFTDTCNNNSNISSKFSDICKNITNEYKVKVINQEYASKQNDKWEKYHDDNYVEYNRNSPNGYSAVKKKSNWRVLGEGVLPILPNAIPIWFGNYQMKNNIEMLTDQAMMQKQYLHNVDIYNSSPWMYNYNYFSYGNPFATNTSLGLGSTTSGAGFNFGQ